MAPGASRMSDEPDPPVTAAVNAMLLSATRVSELLDTQLIGSTTVMLPVPGPLAFVVVTTTLDEASAVLSVDVSSSESFTDPDAANVLGPLEFALESVPLMPAADAFAWLFAM